MVEITRLTENWFSVIPQVGKNISRRADPQHNLDFFIGYDETARMELTLISSKLPNLPVSSQHIMVRGNKRNDGRYALCFSLEDAGLSELFISLCWDIMESTFTIANEDEGVLRAIKRFRLWQSMLAQVNDSQLSEIAIRGLLGELAVLRDICIPKYGPNVAVSGWVGSLKADRDFEYSYEWYEVKATSLSNSEIVISSFDQLDVETPGYLVVCRIEKTSKFTPEATSLNLLVSEIRILISGNPEAILQFDTKLRVIGYSNNLDAYDQSYKIHGFEMFIVQEDFPRLRRSLLSESISGGSYSLNLAALQIWICGNMGGEDAKL